jgi:hypothetical protein
LTLSLDSTPTSCSAGGADGSKGYDGVLLANATGGIAPFVYNWSFSNASSNSVTGLGELGSNYYIYQNSLNSSFIDTSTATVRNMEDPTHYYSAPYSFSMTPQANMDSLNFNYPTALNATKVFYLLSLFHSELIS